MALTLREAAKAAMDDGDVKRAAVIMQFAQSSDILDALTFMDIPGGAYRYSQEAALPGIAFRGVNESYTPSTGVINPLVESLFIAGGELDVDNFIIKTQGADARSRHEAMKVKALSADVTRCILKGDNASEPREFDGLQNRIVGGQVVSNSAAAGGAGLSLAKLDEAIEQTAHPTHIIMHRTIKRLLMAAARTSSVTGFVPQTRDDLGRMFDRYAGLPILSGYPPNRNDAILPFEETATGGGGAVTTSIYIVGMDESGLTGIQNGGMGVKDLGELQEEPKWRTRVEWFPGMVLLDGFRVSRLRNIANAAITA